MKRLFLAAALAALPGLALAGSLSINLTSTPLTGTATYTVSDADATKLIAYVQAAYPDRANPAFDPACVVNPNAVPPVLSCPAARLNNNAAQSLKAWADGIVAGTIANVQSAQRATATKTASDAVTPIDIK